MPDLVGWQLASEGVALPPGVQPAVADVVVVVDRADVVARVAAAVPSGVVDGVDARVGPERVAVGCLGVLPGHVDEPGAATGPRPGARRGLRRSRSVRRRGRAGATGGGRTSAPARWPRSEE